MRRLFFITALLGASLGQSTSLLANAEPVAAVPLQAPRVRFLESTPTSPPTPVDPTVGTANAPTTAGGKCLGQDDYAAWKNGGYTNFGADMQSCAESCAASLAPVNCGFLQTCDPHPYQTCISKCMATPAQADRTKLKLLGPAYTANCTVCMGELSQCVVDNCKTKCVTGGQTSDACAACTVTNCNPDFMVCSGLNPNRAPSSQVDGTLVLGVSLGVVGALLLVSVVVAFLRWRRNQKAKELTMEDLAKLSAAQQYHAQQQVMQTYSAQQLVPAQKPLTQQDVISMMQQAQQYGVLPPIDGATPQNSAMSSGTFYSQPQAGMMTPPHYVPSMSAQQVYQNKSSVALTDMMGGQATELLVLYDFEGEREDELTCMKDDVVSGIEENDGWWLAKSKTGKIGLIPSNYVKVRDVRVMSGINF